MENSEKDKFVNFITLNYLLKIGGYSIVAFGICLAVIDKIDLDSIFKIDINTMWLSIIVAIVIGVISGTIDNVYNCIKKANNIAFEFQEQKKELEKKEKRIVNILSEKEDIALKYNNLFKDFDCCLILTKTVLEDLELAIKDRTPEESTYLKQLYDVTFVKYNHMNNKGER